MIKVMIIEDDPMVRDINCKFLNKVEGFQLSKAAGSLSEAQSFIKAHKVDLILLDIYLPNENGIDFLKNLRKEEISSDVILITADKTINRIQDAFRYGAVDYLIKPFTFERFREALLKFKDRYENFKKADQMAQNELDKFVFGNNELVDENVQTDLAKGLNRYTYHSIWEHLVSLAGAFVTAEEVAESLGIARVTVRKYLEYMEKEAKLEKVIEYGKVGRPLHKYRLLH